jgi:prophage regulatory protein
MKKFLRQSEVTGRTRLSRTTIWRRERAGTFPARRSLGPNSVGWLEDEINHWIETRSKRCTVAQSASAAA